ncbi:MAG: stage III sporulation protein AA [Bacillota bacterium]|jgi:stage III sporulation protein AA
MGMPLKISLHEPESKTVIKTCREVFPYLSPELRKLMTSLPAQYLIGLEEIRLRVNAPVLLRHHLGDSYLSVSGNLTSVRTDSFTCNKENLEKTVVLLCNSSLYALEEEMQKGYLTLPGGHRAGFVGRAVLDHGNLKTLKQISSVNIRIARFVSGCAQKLINYIVNENTVQNTLIISPPRAGKTTILRDIVTTLSDGYGNFSPIDVGIVDERSEIAGCREGIPQMPVGHRTDVLDGCPKAEGMMMLVRSMSPHVIATDEIGRYEDTKAIQEVINAGIKLVATVHGSSIKEICRRPVVQNIVKQRVFERYVILSRRKGPGTLEAIYNRDLQQIM